MNFKTNLMSLACAFILLFAVPAAGEQSTLAIIEAGVQQSEDAPFAPASYTFLPGDYLYFTFDISGFFIQSLKTDTVRKISLTYEVTPEDANGVPLTAPASASIETELSPEDKRWTPKRRVSFLLPSYTASGTYHVHVAVKDVFGKAQTERDFPFHIGGVEIEPSAAVNVQNFQFLRREGDKEALAIAAYSPGDTVFASFDMAGFKLGAANTYDLEYGLSVVQPNGKPFLDAPHAAELKSNSFYPAQYLPGVIKINTPADCAKGEYVLTLTVRDLIGKTKYEAKKIFSVE